jgi:hypothetical protein
LQADPDWFFSKNNISRKASAPAHAPYLHPCRQRRQGAKKTRKIIAKEGAGFTEVKRYPASERTGISPRGRSCPTGLWIACANAFRLVDLIVGRLDCLTTYSAVVDLNQYSKV